jgi:SAM-dependent methyltransferase
VEHPAGTYAKFSVENQIAFIRRGGVHPTLGQKVQKYDDWWKAGESDFRSYLRRFGMQAHDRLVDYGCGSLRVGAHFIRYLQHDRYFGLDVTMDFIELGIAEIGDELIREKRPRFGPLEEGPIGEAADFAPDWVIATACAFQIHPDDKPEFFGNIKRIAHRPGCTVCFDAKVAPEHFRYRNSAWAWPLEHYVEQLAPLELVADHKVGEHFEVGRAFEAHILAFRRT